MDRSSPHNIKSVISRAWYSNSIPSFLTHPPTEILGKLASNGDFSLLTTQRDAWLDEIVFLKEYLVGLTGSIFLEFNIPRMGKRVDAVLLIGPIVFVLEFKIGEETFNRAAQDQVWDYALDLKNFHKASHAAVIVPILIVTGAAKNGTFPSPIAKDHVYEPITVSPIGFRKVIDTALLTISGKTLNNHQWARAPYRPTPTIIEAARALYSHHSVEAIARHDAGAKNLRLTSRRIEELVNEAKTKRQKLICFVTGVPGAGKTLVGLNIATHRYAKTHTSHAVFLSGNGPLVEVLREALARDEVTRQKENGAKIRKGEITGRIKAFIQNVHHFRDEGLNDTGIPSEHVVVFDEAQRAWNQKQTANFMLRKKKRPGFTQSEPEFLISYMNRHPDWAVIVCLVGGGQEINTGEAGIGAWIDAIITKFPHWHMYLSSRLTDQEYAAGKAIEMSRQHRAIHFDDTLHLAVSMRSFRAEKVSSFVKTLLDQEKAQAKKILGRLIGRYPMAVTRRLDLAKKWIYEHARGSERYGLLASSKAQRLKPHAIDIRVPIDPVHWFLNDKEDVRSSYYLEDAATEFQVQGLELDWACVTWDADFRITEADWSFHDFRGNRWINISNTENQNYLRNAYRVLLTRARQGMVIFVPSGDIADHTRPPKYYNQIFNYLTELGIPVLA